jgi:3-oxoacyl-[acyl-carrier protein] reductase
MKAAPTLLITGATGSMGEATVRVLANRGDQLVLTGRNAELLADLYKNYGGEGSVVTLAVDVSRPDDAAQAVAFTKQHFGRIDGLVHLVGGFHIGSVNSTGLAVHQQLMEANFLSAVVATQAILPELDEGGRLVYVGSLLAAEPLGGFGAYAASKAALLSWVRALAHEVKHRDIHANAVMMTMADTPEARRSRPNMDYAGAVTPEMVARAIAFLTSDASDGLYGSVVPVLGRYGYRAPAAALQLVRT